LRYLASTGLRSELTRRIHEHFHCNRPCSAGGDRADALLREVTSYEFHVSRGWGMRFENLKYFP
jgi:hypothetical protein